MKSELLNEMRDYLVSASRTKFRETVIRTLVQILMANQTDLQLFLNCWHLSHGASLEVVIATKFTGHVMVESMSEGLMAAGFKAGAMIKLKNRITHFFAPGKAGRKDISPNEVLYVNGASEKGALIITVAKDVRGVLMEEQIEIKVKNAILQSSAGITGGSGASASASGGGGAPKLKVPADMGYLSKPGGNSLTVVKNWEKRQHCNDDISKSKALARSVLSVLDKIQATSSDLTSKDLTLVLRDDELEVWTARDFAANKLEFFPQTEEVYERHWSMGGKARDPRGTIY